MSFRSTFPRSLRVRASDALSPRGPALLATSLVAGLVLVPPLFALVVDRLSLPIPPLVGVTVVGVADATFVLLSGEYVRAIAVALVATATFAADLPLAAGAGSYPGSLRPALILLHLPLLALAGLLAFAVARRSVEGGVPFWLLAGALVGGARRVQRVRGGASP